LFNETVRLHGKRKNLSSIDSDETNEFWCVSRICRDSLNARSGSIARTVVVRYRILFVEYKISIVFQKEKQKKIIDSMYGGHYRRRFLMFRVWREILTAKYFTYETTLSSFLFLSLYIDIIVVILRKKKLIIETRMITNTNAMHVHT